MCAGSLAQPVLACLLADLRLQLGQRVLLVAGKLYGGYGRVEGDGGADAFQFVQRFLYVHAAVVAHHAAYFECLFHCLFSYISWVILVFCLHLIARLL